MKKPRKGSRTLIVQGVEYSWFKGRKVTEIRNLVTNKAVHVPNRELEQKFVDTCPCYHEEGDGYCWWNERQVVLPEAIRNYIGTRL
jgi:hypothetical protein